MKDLPPLLTFLGYVVVILLTILALRIFLKVDTTEPHYPELQMIEGNSLIAVSNPYYPSIRTYGTLIDCLASKESSNNPDVINWNDCGSPSYGLLQFKKMTYIHFCVNQYGFSEDDLMNPEVQRDCADIMIKNGNLHHWSTAKYCQTL